MAKFWFSGMDTQWPENLRNFRMGNSYRPNSFNFYYFELSPQMSPKIIGYTLSILVYFSINPRTGNSRTKPKPELGVIFGAILAKKRFFGFQNATSVNLRERKLCTFQCLTRISSNSKIGYAIYRYFDVLWQNKSICGVFSPCVFLSRKLMA